MSSVPPRSDVLDMTVHDLLIIPEIQEVLKRGVSEEQPVLDALSMYSYDSSTSASTYDKVADSMSEDAEENMQLEQHGEGGCYQLHSPVYDCSACKVSLLRLVQLDQS